MKPEIKKLWAEALRSGKYKQGWEGLRKGARFCCLGVLCDLKDRDKWEYNNGPYFSYDGNRSFLPKSVADWAGLEGDEGCDPYIASEHAMLSSLNDLGFSFKEIADLSLSDLNDLGFSFKEIADLIEQNL